MAWKRTREERGRVEQEFEYADPQSNCGLKVISYTPLTYTSVCLECLKRLSKFTPSDKYFKSFMASFLILPDPYQAQYNKPS